LTKDCSEKYAKKLIGRTKIEDALKRLDKLTQEEARMASAQNLKITHTIDNRVVALNDRVKMVDNKQGHAGHRWCVKHLQSIPGMTRYSWIV